MPEELVYEHRGERKTLRELAGRYRMNPSTIRHRINRGWTVEDACKVSVRGDKVAKVKRNR